jgi:hypothetical protein
VHFETSGKPILSCVGTVGGFLKHWVHFFTAHHPLVVLYEDKSVC